MDRWLWNPHIVEELHTPEPSRDVAGLFSEKLPNEIEACQKSFIETYKKARKIAPKVVPLAYQLTPNTQFVTADALGVQKFGGMPDLLQSRYVPDYSKQKVKNYGPDEFLERKWPKCKCCGSWMTFVGQIEITAWTQAIHNLTCLKQLPVYSKKPDPKYWRSGLGFASGDKFSQARDWMMFWFCDNGHFDEWTSDCAVVPTTKYERKGKYGSDLYRHEWSDKDFVKAIRKFVKKNKIKTRPIYRVNGYRLTFNMDPWKNYDWKSKTHASMDGLRDHPLFRQDGPFHLFGAPRSQQEERRYICQNRYRMVHAMAPLLGWNDDERDVTHQMYGCLGCRDRDFATMWGKMDSSFT